MKILSHSTIQYFSLLCQQELRFTILFKEINFLKEVRALSSISFVSIYYLDFWKREVYSRHNKIRCSGFSAHTGHNYLKLAKIQEYQIFFSLTMTITDNQKRVQKPDKHLRWSVLRKQLAILAKRPMFDRVLNTLLIIIQSLTNGEQTMHILSIFQ